MVFFLFMDEYLIIVVEDWSVVGVEIFSLIKFESYVYDLKFLWWNVDMRVG